MFQQFILAILYFTTLRTDAFSSRAYDNGGIVEGCCENRIAFGCQESGHVIVVKEAWVHDQLYRVPKNKCHIPEYNVQFKRGSVLQHVNKKCDMQRSCHFNVFTDVPGAEEDQHRWRGHVLRLDYECVREDAFYRTCGEEISDREGWLQNVGYPKYYLGPEVCTFTIVGDEGQKIQLEILDLSIRDIVRPSETECQDYISVTEGLDIHLTSCGGLYKPISLTSNSHILNISLHSTAHVFTKRGFIAKFKATGCKSPPIPEDGYISQRNETYAEVWCCVRHVFPDTMSRTKSLYCKNKLQWDKDVPDCVDLEDLLLAGNITEQEYWRYNGSVTSSFLHLQNEIVYDVIVPGVLMSFLILGNVGIILLIIMCRRGIKGEKEDLEELESIKANAEPTDVTDPVPCQV